MESITPRGYWLSKSNMVQELAKAEQKLGVRQVSLIVFSLSRYLIFFFVNKKPEDWYSITLADLREIGFTATLTKPKLAELLEEKYPDYAWEKVYLLRGRFAKQKRLERSVKQLFPVCFSRC